MFKKKKKEQMEAPELNTNELMQETPETTNPQEEVTNETTEQQQATQAAEPSEV
jgi:molecular chaperone GrpE